MPRNTKNVKHSVIHTLDTIGPGTLDRIHVERLFNLYTEVLETLDSGDGNVAQVQKIQFRIQVWGTDLIPFSIQPVIVQTAGAFVDTIDQNTDDYSVALEAAIDDVFGYFPLGEEIYSRFAPGGSVQIASKSITIPSNFLQIINREQGTERLQDLFVGFLMKHGAVAAHQVHTFITVDYREVRKAIILR